MKLLISLVYPQVYWLIQTASECFAYIVDACACFIENSIVQNSGRDYTS